jgi:HemK-like putative methylase
MKSQDEEWLLKEKYHGEKCEAFFADCERLAGGEPLGYVIGQVPFLDCVIHLDSKPLIPRVETEFWVEKAIEEIRRVAPAAPRVLDLCAGSGCVGVAVGKAVPMAGVDFAEIDARHLPTIQKNLSANHLDSHQHQIIQSDLFQNIPDKYNFILSNPPYIDPILDRTETSVKSHEPHLALYGGQHGLDIIKSIIAEAPTHLLPHGQLWLEHEPEQSPVIQTIGQQHGFKVNTHQDQYQVERYSVLVLQ